MQITKGKLEGITAVADEKGVIRAAAMDQRGSLKKALAREKNVDPSAITSDMMSEFKGAVIHVLSPYASGVLLDPEYGLEAAKEAPVRRGPASRLRAERLRSDSAWTHSIAAPGLDRPSFC